MSFTKMFFEGYVPSVLGESNKMAEKTEGVIKLKNINLELAVKIMGLIDENNVGLEEIIEFIKKRKEVKKMSKAEKMILDYQKDHKCSYREAVLGSGVGISPDDPKSEGYTKKEAKDETVEPNLLNESLDLAKKLVENLQTLIEEKS